MLTPKSFDAALSSMQRMKRYMVASVTFAAFGCLERAAAPVAPELGTSRVSTSAQDGCPVA
eukprot:10179926-Lingulodinium_polyedra.AAC.1